MMHVTRPISSMRACRTLSVRGFTLVELLVVVAIMAVLATIAMPLAELSQRRAQEEDLRRSLREIRGALDQYKRLVDAGHIEKVLGEAGYPPSLQVLVSGVTDVMSPQGAKIYLLRSLPRDPFAPADIADPADTWAARSYVSPPDDPKAGDDVFDVHSRSSTIGSNGVAYRNW